MLASYSQAEYGKRPALMRAGAKLIANTKSWWLARSDDERREVIAAGSWGTVGLAAVISLFAFVPQQFALQKEAAEYRATVAAFTASYNGPEAPVRSQKAPQTEVAYSANWISDWSAEVADTNVSLKISAADYQSAAGLVDFATNIPRQPLYTEAQAATTEHKCLATAIYYEARSESLSGQLAVAEVIMNRVADARFPGTVCDVVYQGSYRNTGCQFTFTCDGALARKPRGIRWQRAQSVAAHVVLGLNEPRTGGATHYHADYVDPIWNSGLVKTEKIGTHIFYRFPRGREWAQYRQALAERRARRLRVIQSVASTEAPEAQGVVTEAASAPAP